MQALGRLIRRGFLIDRQVRKEVEKATGFADYETTDPAEYLAKLNKHCAQLEHKIVTETPIKLPGAPKEIPKPRERKLQDDVDRLEEIIMEIVYDIYGINIDRDFVEKQIVPRVLKVVSRWTASFVTEKVPTLRE